MSSKSVIAWNPAYRVRLTEVSRITVTRITVQCTQLICRAFAGHALRAHAPTQIKTPPGIGRRFEEEVQRSLRAILHRNLQIFNSCSWGRAGRPCAAAPAIPAWSSAVPAGWGP